MSAGADGSAVTAQVAALRARYTRVQPEDLPGEAARGALVVDTRPVEQRERDGALPGALVIDRNVLEWRLDPTSPYRLSQVSPQSRIVLVCDQGFSSTLAAASLQSLGLTDATDVVNGFQGLVAHDDPAHAQDRQRDRGGTIRRNPGHSRAT